MQANKPSSLHLHSHFWKSFSLLEILYHTQWEAVTPEFLPLTFWLVGLCALLWKKIQNWHHAAYHWYISVDNDHICVNGMNAWLVIAHKTACGFCHFSCNKHEVDWGQAEDVGGILQPRLQDLLLPGRRCYDFCTYPKVWGGGGKYGLAVCWRKGLCDNCSLSTEEPVSQQ